MNIFKAAISKKVILVSLCSVILLAFVFSEVSTDKNALDNYKNYFVSDNNKVLLKGAVRVTSFGTTTLLLDDGETQILLDALLTRPSLPGVLTSTIETDKQLVDHILKQEKINRLKAIFVSHSHYDHSLDVACIAKQTNAQIYGSESTLNIGRGGNVPEDKLTLFQINQPVRAGKFIVTVIPSIHSKPNIFNNDLGKIIEKPLKQPAKMRDYVEGGSFDFLVQYGHKTILVRPSFNYLVGQLDNIRADVLFLGIGGLGKTDLTAKDIFYDETVKKVKPNLIIPIHWDNFFLPINEPLEVQMKIIDNLLVGLDYMIKKTTEDHISFKMLQSYQSIILFQDN